MEWTWSLGLLSTDSHLGADYLEAMRLAGDYAYAGRDGVCARVAEILGAPIVEEVHNHGFVILPLNVDLIYRISIYIH